MAKFLFITATNQVFTADVAGHRLEWQTMAPPDNVLDMETPNADNTVPSDLKSFEKFGWTFDGVTLNIYFQCDDNVHPVVRLGRALAGRESL